MNGIKDTETKPNDLDSKSIVTISFCGDVMTGRGIDQVLAHPCDPVLHEPYVKDARRYVKLAMGENGQFSLPVDDTYVWGDALEIWNLASPDLRIVNLENAITTSDDFWPDKGVHYRMNPRNIGCITAANIDCCVVANNHILDFGHDGFIETLSTLKKVDMKTAGAGTVIRAAKAPTVMEISGKGRVLLFAFGNMTSGIPREWAAQPKRPGVHLLRDLSMDEIESVRQSVESHKRDGDVVIASIHWGPNWSYEVSPTEEAFAHGLIDDACVDLVYGHSSHHVKRIEKYRGKLILYGCGDFLNDYEGIMGHQQFRGDLGLNYFVSIEPLTGILTDLQMVPTQMQRMQVRYAEPKDAEWLINVFNRESNAFGIRVEQAEFHGHVAIRLSSE